MSIKNILCFYYWRWLELSISDGKKNAQHSFSVFRRRIGEQVYQIPCFLSELKYSNCYETEKEKKKKNWSMSVLVKKQQLIIYFLKTGVLSHSSSNGHGFITDRHRISEAASPDYRRYPIPALCLDKTLKAIRAPGGILRISLANSPGQAGGEGKAVPRKLLLPWATRRGRRPRHGPAPGGAARLGPVGAVRRCPTALEARRGGGCGSLPGEVPKTTQEPCPGLWCSPLQPPTGSRGHWGPAASLGARESHSTTASHHAHLAAPLGPHSLPWVLDHLSASCRPRSIPQHPANLSASPGPHSIPETPQHPQDPAVSHGGSYLHVSSVTTPGKHTTGSWGSVCTETPVERVVQEKNSISQLLFGQSLLGHGSERCRASESPAKEQKIPKNKHSHKQTGTKVPALLSWQQVFGPRSLVPSRM